MSEGIAALVVVVVGGNIVVMGIKCRAGTRVATEGRRRHLQQLGEAMLKTVPAVPSYVRRIVTASIKITPPE